MWVIEPIEEIVIKKMYYDLKFIIIYTGISRVEEYGRITPWYNIWARCAIQLINFIAGNPVSIRLNCTNETYI